MNDFQAFSFPFENENEINIGDFETSVIGDCEAIFDDQELNGDFGEGDMIEFENQMPEFACLQMPELAEDMQDVDFMEACQLTPTPTNQVISESYEIHSESLPEPVEANQTKDINASSSLARNRSIIEPQSSDPPASPKSQRTKTFPLRVSEEESDRKRRKQNLKDQQKTDSLLPSEKGGNSSLSKPISFRKDDHHSFSFARLPRPKLLGRSEPVADRENNLQRHAPLKPGESQITTTHLPGTVSKKQTVAPSERKIRICDFKSNLTKDPSKNLSSLSSPKQPKPCEVRSINEAAKAANGLGASKALSISEHSSASGDDKALVDDDDSEKVLKEFHILKSQIEQANLTSVLTNLEDENSRLEKEDVKAEERKRSISSQTFELIRQMDSLESGVMDLLIELIDLKTEYLLILDPEFEEQVENLISSYRDNNEDQQLLSPRSSPDPEIRPPSQLAAYH